MFLNHGHIAGHHMDISSFMKHRSLLAKSFYLQKSPVKCETWCELENHHCLVGNSTISMAIFKIAM